jgi:DNA-binding PadR family transcriptional regulator
MLGAMALAPTRLLVLGVVRLLQPIHGYDVRRELLSWQADEWANVAPGSVYGALRTMERDGWIEAVDTSREGARPARTTYRVTDEGEKEFHTLLNGEQGVFGRILENGDQHPFKDVGRPFHHIEHTRFVDPVGTHQQIEQRREPGDAGSEEPSSRS